MKKLAGCLGAAVGIVVLLVLAVALNSILHSASHDSSSKAPSPPGQQILEVRICPRDGINIRKGPGTRYTKVEGGPLVKGEKLYVLQEKDGWIRFRVTPKDVGWSGWAKKDLTVAEGQRRSANQRDQIKDLRSSGLLTSINPKGNEAYVDPTIWQALDFQTKKNIGRVLAFYCGREKGTNLNWVDIKDRYTGKKLAKYSENWGFKTY